MYDIQEQIATIGARYLMHPMNAETIYRIQLELDELLHHSGPVVFEDMVLERILVKESEDNDGTISLDPQWRFLCPTVSRAGQDASVSTSSGGVRGIRSVF